MGTGGSGWVLPTAPRSGPTNSARGVFSSNPTGISGIKPPCGAGKRCGRSGVQENLTAATSPQQQSPEPCQELCPSCPWRGQSGEAPRVGTQCPPAECHQPCPATTLLREHIRPCCDVSELPGCSQRWEPLLCRGEGARAARGAWARCPLGSGHSSCPSGMGTSSPSSPLIPCAAALAIPSHGKMDFWVTGSSGDVGTPPIKGARTCGRDPRRGLELEPGWTWQSPELWQRCPAPCASLGGDLGFPTRRKPIAEVW